MMPLSSISRTFAQWQAAWGLQTLLENWDNLVGDTLAKLVASVLLEQKVLLLGDAPRVSAMALVLRGLIWPFRWLHPFLSAPPPPQFLRVPLLDATFPVIVAVAELPAQWGFKTQYELPPDVAVGMLRHDYVYINPAHVTSGGLNGANIKLPAGRHTAFLKQVAQAKQKLRKQEFDMETAVDVVHAAMESEVMKLAQLVQDYAAGQVTAVLETAVADPSRASSLEELRNRCLTLASEPETFMRWLKRSDVLAGPEAEGFYSTFFGTQLCSDLLHTEIISIIARRDA